MPFLYQLFTQRPYHRRSSCTRHRRSIEYYEKLDIINECTPILRKEIITLQNKISTFHHNLQTIRRCIQAKIPPFAPEPLFLPYDSLAMMDPDDETESAIEFEDELRLGLEELSRRAILKPLLGCSSSDPGAKHTCPNWLIDKPREYRPEEIRIPLPITISPSDLDALMRETNCEEEGILCLLVLKKAECQIEVDHLEGELIFWTGIWECISAVRQEIYQHSDLRNGNIAAERTRSVTDGEMRLSLSGQEGRWVPRASVNRNGLTRRIRRKEVPVKKMLERIREEQKQLAIKQQEEEQVRARREMEREREGRDSGVGTEFGVEFDGMEDDMWQFTNDSSE